MSRDRYHVFGALRPPEAPSELRASTVAAARAAAEAAGTTEVPRKLLTDRLWTSRPLRFAWAASVVALVGVNIWLDAEIGHRAIRAAEAGLTVAASGRGEGAPERTLLTVRGEVLDALFAAEPAGPEKAPFAPLPRRAS